MCANGDEISSRETNSGKRRMQPLIAVTPSRESERAGSHRCSWKALSRQRSPLYGRPGQLRLRVISH